MIVEQNGILKIKLNNEFLFKEITMSKPISYSFDETKRIVIAYLNHYKNDNFCIKITRSGAPGMRVHIHTGDKEDLFKEDSEK